MGRHMDAEFEGVALFGIEKKIYIGIGARQH